MQLTLVFYSFFKTLVDQEVTVELKNDLAIKGILKSVDQFLNIKLDEISVLEEDKYPHLVHPHKTLMTDCGKKCVHSRIGGEVCPSSCISGGHGITGRCDATRSILMHSS
jgi:small nuclear ribonucleoprotein (snRNP)-like protein